MPKAKVARHAWSESYRPVRAVELVPIGTYRLDRKILRRDFQGLMFVGTVMVHTTYRKPYTTLDSHVLILRSQSVVRARWRAPGTMQHEHDPRLTTHDSRLIDYFFPLILCSPPNLSASTYSMCGPFVYFDLGQGKCATCNPISEPDLAAALVDQVASDAFKNGIWNLGGPDDGTLCSTVGVKYQIILLPRLVFLKLF